LDFKVPTLLAGILDTHRVANQVFEIWAGSLGDLFGVLGCPLNQLHCVGNVARFTSRALLLLAVQGFINKKENQEGDNQTLDILLSFR
jgi:hypothetical protein